MLLFIVREKPDGTFPHDEKLFPASVDKNTPEFVPTKSELPFTENTSIAPIKLFIVIVFHVFPLSVEEYMVEDSSIIKTVELLAAMQPIAPEPGGVT
jgi:hypothetical protein